MKDREKRRVIVSICTILPSLTVVVGDYGGGNYNGHGCKYTSDGKLVEIFQLL